MAIEDTGWKKPELVVTEDGPAGRIVPASGLVSKPCMMCRSFEKDEQRLRQHFKARGLKPDRDGFYETPIAQEIKGRKSLRMHPRDFGWCRREGSVVHMNATCELFLETNTRSELAAKLGKP